MKKEVTLLKFLKRIEYLNKDFEFSKEQKLNLKKLIIKWIIQIKYIYMTLIKYNNNELLLIERYNILFYTLI